MATETEMFENLCNIEQQPRSWVVVYHLKKSGSPEVYYCQWHQKLPRGPTEQQEHIPFLLLSVGCQPGWQSLFQLKNWVWNQTEIIRIIWEGLEVRFYYLLHNFTQELQILD